VASGGGKQQTGETVGMGTGFLMLGGIFGALFTALWFVRHDQLARFFLHYSWFLSYPAGELFRHLGFIHSYPVRLMMEISVMSYHIREVTAGQLFGVVNRASYYLVPFLSLLVVYAIRTHSNITSELNKLHQHRALMEIQSRTNPCIYPVYVFTEYWEKTKQDRPASLNRAEMPDEFAKRHNLIITRTAFEAELDFDKAEKVFAEQVGPVFNLASMAEYRKALAAIFATRIAFRGETGREKAASMLDQINKSCSVQRMLDAAAKRNGKVDYLNAFEFSGVAKEFAPLIKNPAIAEILKFFVHETTFLMRLLNEARRDGKLSPSDFIWLKLVDRPLWYALYGVSNTLIAKGYTEGLGPFGQYWSAMSAMENNRILLKPYMYWCLHGFEKRLFEANMISGRKRMTDKEKKREEEFGRIPDLVSKN
jgi:intracellular multiplication protein IcmP